MPEYAPSDWNNPATRNALKVFNARIEGIQDKYIKLMAQHIKNLGRMTASDITRLEQMRLLSANINEIQKDIAAAAQISDSELQDIFEKTCTFEGNDFLKTVVDANNHINWKDNVSLRDMMESQVRMTQGDLMNFANTTVVSKPYVDLVDRAILSVQSGLSDYNTEIRNAVKKAATAGLQVVEYASGHKRRLDSAMRQNILDGMRNLAQKRLNIIGAEIGADGVEISAHLLCAEDHLPYQGEQVSNEEFENIQSILDRPFGMWNCKHWWTPIMLGMAAPTYTPDELEEYKQYSLEQITIGEGDDAITRTRYQWSQEMRRLETGVRRQKDIAAFVQQSGDDTALKQARTMIVRYNNVYNQIVAGTGLQPHKELMRSAQTLHHSLTNTQNSVIIKPIKINLQLFAFKNRDLLDSHWDKHGHEFGFENNNPKNADDYERMAEALSKAEPSDDVLRYVRKSDGATLTYRISTNDFVVVHKKGYIQSFFKPTDAIEYFKDQID